MFHYTPKHANWLNMDEIEIGVLKGQCLDRRIGSSDRLVAEIDVWRESQRNQSGAQINWMFSTDKARTKMARAYADPSLKESPSRCRGTSGSNSTFERSWLGSLMRARRAKFARCAQENPSPFRPPIFAGSKLWCKTATRRRSTSGGLEIVLLTGDGVGTNEIMRRTAESRLAFGAGRNALWRTDLTAWFVTRRVPRESSR